jgi:hypothetical protein
MGTRSEKYEEDDSWHCLTFSDAAMMSDVSRSWIRQDPDLDAQSFRSVPTPLT